MYKNAPLVEIIVEIRWHLIPIRTVPNGGVDPHFADLESKLLPQLVELGYNDVQRLIPQEVPLEILAHKLIYRCRTAKEKWPLIQFGPGVITANAVPPYEGWDSFWPVVKQAISSVFSDTVHDSNKPKIESISVRYIDAFNEKHKIDSPQSFMSNHLSLTVGMPKQVMDSFGSGSVVSDIGMHQGFLVNRPKGATCLLRCGTGAVHETSSVILDTQIRSHADATWASESDVAEWVLEAKGTLKDIFESIISDDLRDKMEPVS